MLQNKNRFSPIVIALAVLLSGATAGAIFGERSMPEDETELMVRASKVVNLLLEWAPTEQDPADIVYDGIGGMLEVLDPHSNFLDPRSFHKMRQSSIWVTPSQAFAWELASWFVCGSVS